MLFILDQAISKLFKIKALQLIYLVGIIFALSLTMYKNEIELGESGSIMQPIVTLILGFIPLVIVVITAKWKKENQSRLPNKVANATDWNIFMPFKKTLSSN
ncbi:hypothetical protein [Fictibacillus barbaricus]|uniref:ABC-type spermidine/putrescine transport system permease subunit II n=1 Tax=Fictibacillus barbaricus TaxID=182136 RepID=A0ABU1TV53_9BACL|nr:hypothetical protein [Fictibacillus barbaricus]MDR7071097.1 ABC-type spermidine/putrescine transport system permease subunit II [Fictibacillus barbaricus]